jgi:transposase
MSNLQLVNAIPYVTENGCKWRALPKSFGNWHTVYLRMHRWSKNGALKRLIKALQTEGIIRIKMEHVHLDGTTAKVHPNWTGALKNRKKSIGKSRGGLTYKIHMVTASDRAAVTFSLSGGNAHDAPVGRACLTQ